MLKYMILVFGLATAHALYAADNKTTVVPSDVLEPRSIAELIGKVSQSELEATVEESSELSKLEHELLEFLIVTQKKDKVDIASRSGPTSNVKSKAGKLVADLTYGPVAVVATAEDPKVRDLHRNLLSGGLGWIRIGGKALLSVGANKGDHVLVVCQQKSTSNDWKSEQHIVFNGEDFVLPFWHGPMQVTVQVGNIRARGNANIRGWTRQPVDVAVEVVNTAVIQIEFDDAKQQLKWKVNGNQNGNEKDRQFRLMVQISGSDTAEVDRIISEDLRSMSLDELRKGNGATRGPMLRADQVEFVARIWLVDKELKPLSQASSVTFGKKK